MLATPKDDILRCRRFGCEMFEQSDNLSFRGGAVGGSSHTLYDLTAADPQFLSHQANVS